MGTAGMMLDTARKYIGVTGRPNTFTRDYAGRHGSEFLSVAWCDMFVTYCARVSGNSQTVLPAGDRAYTPWHAGDFQKIGRWLPGTAANVDKARPGDVVFFDWGQTNTIDAIDHVGLVEVVLGDGRVQTIEGNTGDAVKRKVRGAADIAGIGQPLYIPSEVGGVFGIDYAWEHPSIRAMTAAGVQFVCRYLSNDPSKNLTRDEASALGTAGIWSVVVWETSAQRALAGVVAGIQDATQAQAQATAAGMPADRPIYFAVDWDASPTQQDAINEYLRGAASIIGLERVGIYGGYWPVKRALDAGVVKWAWQTYAWSGINWDLRAQIQQYRNEVVLPGTSISVDYDRAMEDDYGQWKIGVSPMAITDADALKIAKAVWLTDGIIEAPPSQVAQGNTHWAAKSFLYWGYLQGGDVLAAVTKMANEAGDDVDEAAIVAGVLAGLNPDTIAETIATRLGPGVGARVLDELKARLES